MFHSVKKAAAGVAALAGLGLGGAALADAAASSSSTPQTGSSVMRTGSSSTPQTGSSAQRTGSSSTPQTGSSAQRPPQMPAPGTPAHEDAEKAVTGEAATKAAAAAVKSVGGGTAGSVTTDYFGSGYEVVVTKADGTKVEVHLDSSFNVQGPPGGHGTPWSGHGAPPPGAPAPGAPPNGRRPPAGAGAPPPMSQ